MSKKYLITVVFLIPFFLFSQNKSLEIQPMFWWKNSVHKNLQLLLHGEHIADFNKIKTDNPNIIIDSILKMQSNNYLFVYLHFNEKVSEKVNFVIQDKNKNEKTFEYEFKTLNKSHVNTINSDDNIYLLFPDRFANGDNSNDIVNDMFEKKIDRKGFQNRHGGDIQGIINHLDYLSDMGIKAVWLNPVLINNQYGGSYHGYALTDYYTIDPRFGSNSLFKSLCDSLENRNIKMVWDLVPNHVGSEHKFFLDFFDSSFVHQWDTFTQCNFRPNVLLNPYSSEFDNERVEKGWFVTSMPDVNEQQKDFSLYMMQSYLWWVNYAGIDGFRIDTYPYNDIQFMNKCLRYIKDEYDDDFWSTGEIWEKSGVAPLANLTEWSNLGSAPYNNELTSAKDFQLMWALQNALNKKAEWNDGIVEVYNILAQDGMYQNPNLNMTFLDNHDMERFYSVVGEDIKKWKMGTMMLYTLRGIPCIYYGSELLFGSSIPRKDDGEVRQDFPGGWPGDSINLFVENERNSIQKEAYNFMKKIINLRNENPSLSSGRLKLFVPQNGLFTYFKYDDEHCFLISVNRSESTKLLPTKDYKEMLRGFSHGKNMLNNKKVDLNNLNLEVNDFVILKIY